MAAIALGALTLQAVAFGLARETLWGFHLPAFLPLPFVVVAWLVWLSTAVWLLARPFGRSDALLRELGDRATTVGSRRSTATTLDEYAALVLASGKVAREAEPRPAAEAANWREERCEAARERQRLADARRPVQQKIDRLEGEIARLTTELRELDAGLAAPDFYQEAGDEVAEALRERGTLATRLEQLESRWLDLHGELEAIS